MKIFVYLIFFVFLLKYKVIFGSHIPLKENDVLNYNRTYQTDEDCEALHREHNRLIDLDLIDGFAFGNTAEPREFPFVVAIYSRQPGVTEYSYICDGSIITKRHVLTAANCINQDPEAYQHNTFVRYGSTRLDEGMKEVKLAKVPHYFNDLYKGARKGYDISLFFLANDIQIGADAFPICIHRGETELQENERMTIAGFGRLKNNNVALLRGQIDIENNERCSTFMLGNIKLKEHQICVRNTDCFEDISGDPLVQTNGDYKILVGIPSYGPAICAKGRNLPSVYTKVSSFLTWIQEKVENDFNELKNDS